MANGLHWLVEYEGAKPAPVYAPNDEQTDGFYTCNPWRARRFESQEAAEIWMGDTAIHVPYGSPWKATQHGFGAGRGIE